MTKQASMSLGCFGSALLAAPVDAEGRVLAEAEGRVLVNAEGRVLVDGIIVRFALEGAAGSSAQSVSALFKESSHLPDKRLYEGVLESRGLESSRGGNDL